MKIQMTAEQIKAHVDHADECLRLIQGGFALLEQTGLSAFEINLNRDFEDLREQASRAALRKLNANFCQEHISSDTLPYNRQCLIATLGQPITAALVEQQIALINNQYQPDEVLKNALHYIHESAFSKKNKMGDMSNLHTGYISDVLIVLSDLMGLKTDVVEMNNKVEFPRGKATVEFAELGAELILQANGKVFLKLNDAAVELLNRTLSPAETD